MSNFISKWKNKLPASRGYLWAEMQKLQEQLQGDTAETKEQVMNLEVHMDECASEFKLELQSSIAQLSEYVNQLQTDQTDSIRKLQGDIAQLSKYVNQMHAGQISGIRELQDGIEQETRRLKGVIDRAQMEWREGAGKNQEEILKKIFAELRAHRVRSVDDVQKTRCWTGL